MLARASVQAERAAAPVAEGIDVIVIEPFDDAEGGVPSLKLSKTAPVCAKIRNSRTSNEGDFDSRSFSLGGVDMVVEVVAVVVVVDRRDIGVPPQLPEG